MKQRWNLLNQVTRYSIVYVCAIKYFIVKWKYIIIIITSLVNHEIKTKINKYEE